MKIASVLVFSTMLFRFHNYNSLASEDVYSTEGKMEDN
jgi:hypothetical protein